VLRNNQRKVLAVPNTSMVVATDCGEWNDIHPLNKKDIGLRLSLAAQKLAYNEEIVFSGPLYESFVIEGDSIVLTFKHTGSGLITSDDEPLRYFAIAGADKKFVWANARIDSNHILVWSSEVSSPKFVRYNWADNPDGNLFNKEGLPASSFTTE
jgi:sialate O-acetylesterase